MNLFTAMLTTIALLPSASTEAQTMDITRPEGQAQRSAQRKVESEQQSQLANEQGTTRPSGELQQRIAPGPARLTDEVLFGDVWRRPELSPHDRSLVTIAVSIATGKTTQLAGHLGRALANGVQPSEASGVLAHLAIYCGWPSAVSALEVYEQVYSARKVDTAALRAVGPRLPAPVSDAAQAKALNDELAAVAPKFVQLTTTSCSVICGGGPISVCGIAAWSPSPRWPRWAMTTRSISTSAAGSRAV